MIKRIRFKSHVLYPSPTTELDVDESIKVTESVSGIEIAVDPSRAHFIPWSNVAEVIRETEAPKPRGSRRMSG
jgi:hypothetical protein